MWTVGREANGRACSGPVWWQSNRVKERDPEMRGALAALGHGRCFEALRLCPRYLLRFSVVKVNDVAVGVDVLLPGARAGAASCAGCGAVVSPAGLVHAERVFVFVIIEIFV